MPYRLLSVISPRHFFWERAFRPFFMGAMLVSILAMAAWLVAMNGETQHGLNNALAHGHEMVFGYALATVAGFLLTAVLNWSRMTTASGGALAFVFLLWALARIGWVSGAPLIWLVGFDLAFNLGLVALFVWPIWRKKLTAQAGLASKFVLLAGVQAGFYWAECSPSKEVWGLTAHDWLLAGLFLVLAINLTMLRRLLPFFTERSLHLAPFAERRGLDRGALVSFLGLWPSLTFWPDHWVTSVIALSAFIVFLKRGLHWFHPGIISQPLLWPLHLAYAFITLGLGLYAFTPCQPALTSLALHSMTVGGIGLLCTAIIARISLGHTQRNVFEPPRFLSAVFVFIAFAALVRVGLPGLWPQHTLIWWTLSAALWILAFAWLLRLYWSILTRPNLPAPNQLR
ncbi:NnrS family protein [Thiomicrospira sp. WB1]|uniref:NnrS family protein n=1 Tax=Thiomicrospira sp. WB1 TaxID=1685380 RepID=UPI0007468B30|nr:NnrS family protein [Thiomicrospira sp. WB1]KUJ72372.1 hypothetical protein AVO41_00720 [Thiomicrospira sp. WB1]